MDGKRVARREGWREGGRDEMGKFDGWASWVGGFDWRAGGADR